MGLGLFLIPALGGYWALTRSNRWKWEVLRDTGYHLVFRSTCMGAGLTVLSYLLLLPLWRLVSPDFLEAAAGWVGLSKLPALTQAAPITGAALGFVLPYVLNRFCTPEEGARQAATDRGDLVELVLQDSIDRLLTAEIVLSSGKVYIGYAVWSGLFRRDGSDHDISLLPIASGYRHPKTKALYIEVDYHESVYRKVTESETSQSRVQRIRGMSIALPLSEVRSARLFDLELYEYPRDSEGSN